MEKLKFPIEYTNLLDMDRILQSTNCELKVTLKRDSVKGTGLYVTHQIKNGEVIAYYKITVFDIAGYDSPTNGIYSFAVYTCNGNTSQHLIGDIALDSMPPPSKGIPYWGMFVNEPSYPQTVNAFVDMNLVSNFVSKKKKGVRAGRKMVYKVVAVQDIEVGDEVVIYYGEDYLRHYH